MAAPKLPSPPPSILANSALFLDFDGTVVELAATPTDVLVPQSLRDLLCRLFRALNGRIAIISGRPADGVHGLIGNLPLAVAGSHGLEIRWPDGRLVVPERPVDLRPIVARMEQFAEARPGVAVEVKPFGVALHYRNRPDAMAESHDLAEAIAGDSGHFLQHGKMMVEIRLRGADKGSALRVMMAEPPMAGSRPVFIGDDATDEPGMAAAMELGGVGIMVGEERMTAAAYRLPNVAACLTWLEEACP